MVKEKKTQMKNKLSHLYGKDKKDEIFLKLEKIIKDFIKKNPSLANKDLKIPHKAILITYGDQVQEIGEKPLKTLNDWAKKWLKNYIEAIHILPFYPYSSDDGFSVIDYYKVDENLGNWQDIKEISSNFELMFDAVINHISQHSQWFEGFLQSKEPYKNYFIEGDENKDYSHITRPRTSPLFHEFETKEGKKLVWTTFSKDQIDLNTSNPDVFLEIIKLLLFYVEKGASLIRLDAVTFFWKDTKTNCASLPETHMCVELMRDVMDVVAPNVLLVTETNVPHKENVSYFGDGFNEAQMVYQFALPPLLLHSVLSGSTKELTRWAKDLELPSDKTSFFNITATHDGIGLRGAQDYLQDKDLKKMADKCLENKGKVLYRSVGEKKVPYELNITFFDSMMNKGEDPEDKEVIDRFFAVKSCALSLKGVPGIYIHNLFGSRNNYKGYEKTKQGRTLNRYKFSKEEIENFCKDEKTRENKIFKRYLGLINIWKSQLAFNPNSSQEILEIDNRVFCALRGKETKNPIIALHNMSKEIVDMKINLGKLGLERYQKIKNLISQKSLDKTDGVCHYELKPYETMWLRFE